MAGVANSSQIYCNYVSNQAKKQKQKKKQEKKQKKQNHSGSHFLSLVAMDAAMKISTYENIPHLLMYLRGTSVSSRCAYL